MFLQPGFTDPLPTIYLGRLNDDETLALAYSAADVMVVPSLQDNLPNTAVEAIAFGTPVVAFNTGGLPDIVDHKENGYLAEPYSSEDLARGIEWMLADGNRNKWLSKQARKKAEVQFNIEKVAKRYIKLYKKVVAKS
jgi:glycosyltransferase involved in cell wall biosynthesis